MQLSLLRIQPVCVLFRIYVTTTSDSYEKLMLSDLEIHLSHFGGRSGSYTRCLTEQNVEEALTLLGVQGEEGGIRKTEVKGYVRRGVERGGRGMRVEAEEG